MRILLWTVCLAPWFFGAWERWFFWTFFVPLAASLLVFALRLLMRAFDGLEDHPLGLPGRRGAQLRLLASWTPFLLYAMGWWTQAPVYLEAERSVLGFLVAVAIGAQVAFGFSARALRVAYTAVLTALVLLGLYGILEYTLSHGQIVLWRAGFRVFTVESRVSGSYFCPNHYSGLMELALCLALPLTVRVGPGNGALRWLGLATIPLSALGVTLSASRAGMVTYAVVLLAWSWTGTQHLGARLRCAIRIAIPLAALGAVAFVFAARLPLATRITYEFLDRGARTPSTERPSLWHAIANSSRGRMIAAGWRAWKRAPIFGIGPGMHPNIWFEVAASSDGDREARIWPSVLNTEFVSREVHCDWLQLLQEFGLVGFALFSAAVGYTTLTLWRRKRKLAGKIDSEQRNPTWNDEYAAQVSALLAITAMAIHSTIDFNLQIPATLWLFSVIVALPCAWLPDLKRRRSRKPSENP